MDSLRDEQKLLCIKLPPLMATFAKSIQDFEIRKRPVMFLVYWLKLELDQISRGILPDLQHEYKLEWDKYTVFKGLKRNSTQVYDIEVRLQDLENKIADSAFGIEHLLRELGQLYEASSHGQTQENRWRFLPNAVARLLLNGFPLEIMDGDAACVPLTWVKAVLSSLKRLTCDPKIFVLSVVGIQSSGKSTFLNAMFGLEFAVSAGRCTRGVFLQLLTVNRAKSMLPFDYLLVVDSEGLRAPELAHEKYHHDNELATFVIGLADLTLVNLKGENNVEMRDVLQIAVQAFLRMKLADKAKHQRCIFVHQNVAALNADEKMLQALKKLKENLDKMTSEAAQAEHMKKIVAFSQVIHFRGQQDVAYLSDLWSGDPPMAPVNTGYSTRVKEIRKNMFTRLVHEKVQIIHLSDFINRTEDLWNAILADDFVFSFRNSIAIKAHLSLEQKFSELKFRIEREIMDEKVKRTETIERCDTVDDLRKEVDDARTTLKTMLESILQETLTELLGFIDNNEYKDILEEYRQHKENSLKISTNVLRQKMDQDVTHQGDLQFKALKHTGNRKDLEEAMMQKAMEVAQNMKGKSLSDCEIDREFETMWAELVESVPKVITTNIVKTKMEFSLIKESHVDVDAMVMDLRAQKHSDRDDFLSTDIDDSLFLVDKKNREKPYQKPVEGFRSVLAVGLNELISDCKDRLKILCSKEAQFFFYHCEQFIVDTIHCIEEWKLPRKEDSHFILSPSGKTKLAVHIVQIAINEFNHSFGNEQQPQHTSVDKLSTYLEVDIKSEMENILMTEFEIQGQSKYITDQIKYLHDDTVLTAKLLKRCFHKEDLDDKDHLILEGPETKQSSIYVPFAVKAIIEIMAVLDMKLREICEEDSNFFSTHGTTFVKAIIDEFKVYNQTKAGYFTFSWACIAKCAIFASKHAMIKFEAMNIRYEIAHGSRARLEKFKEQTRTFFVHQVKESEPNVMAADLFCDIIKREIKEKVKKQMPREIQAKMVDEIGYRKQDLVIQILKDLAQKKDISSYMQYLYNAHGYTESWLVTFMEELAFGSEHDFMYADIANAKAESLFSLLITKTKATIKLIEEYDSITTKKSEWCRVFCSEAQTYIALTEADLKIVKDRISDFDKFEKLVLDTILKTKMEVTEEFERVNECSASWEWKHPCKGVLEKLWGCTEQCPFCHEPCKKTDPEHKDSHECLQHRPSCIGGWKNMNTSKPSIATCSVNVSSTLQYKCLYPNCTCKSKVKGTWHDYKKYKSYQLKWYIPPDNNGESSRYWKWFVCTFKDALAVEYGYDPPEVPNAWKNITEAMAVDSLTDLSV